MKIISILFAAMLIISGAAYAQTANNAPVQNPDSQNTPPPQGQNGEHGEGDNFAEHKVEMISELNEEKAGLDKVISCTNAAKKQEDMKACRDIRKDNIEKMHARRISKRKEFLQNQINKLDAESKGIKK